MRGLYVIYDKRADDILANQVMCHASDNVAIRSFNDIAQMPNSGVGAHPEDYQLVRIAQLDEHGDVENTTRECILEGEDWAAEHEKHTAAAREREALYRQKLELAKTAIEQEMAAKPPTPAAAQNGNRLLNLLRGKR